MAGRTLYRDMTGVKIIPSDRLPMRVHISEEARRVVRHNMQAVLRWTGDVVGEEPGSPLHLFIHEEGGKKVLLCSREMFVLIASGVVGDYVEGKVDI